MSTNENICNIALIKTLNMLPTWPLSWRNVEMMKLCITYQLCMEERKQHMNAILYRLDCCVLWGWQHQQTYLMYQMHYEQFFLAVKRSKCSKRSKWLLSILPQPHVLMKSWNMSQHRLLCTSDDEHTASISFSYDSGVGWEGGNGIQWMDCWFFAEMIIFVPTPHWNYWIALNFQTNGI